MFYTSFKVRRDRAIIIAPLWAALFFLSWHKKPRDQYKLTEVAIYQG